LAEAIEQSKEYEKFKVEEKERIRQQFLELHEFNRNAHVELQLM
jgi:hypothetical protein